MDENPSGPDKSAPSGMTDRVSAGMADSADNAAAADRRQLRTFVPLFHGL